MKAIDCATKLSNRSAQALANDKVDIVCRYLGNSWKTFDKTEALAISLAGLKIVSVWETNPTSDGYFTASRGKHDAEQAIKYAKEVGQPEGKPIYFAVDYPGGNTNLGKVEEYFLSIKQHLNGYKVGGYGSYEVVKNLHEHDLIEYVWQTRAWSDNQVYHQASLYQKQNAQRDAGIQVDIDQVFHDPGAWSIAEHAEQKQKDEHHSSEATYTVKPGNNLSTIAAHHGTTVDELMKLNPQIKDPDKIYPGEKIHLPDGSHTYPERPHEKYHTVQSGETLSGIATHYHEPLFKIEALNPKIKDPDLIYPGEKVRVK